MLFGVVFYLLFTAEAATFASQDGSVSNCVKKCGSKFKTACERGCAFAYALTTAPSSYPFNPTCTDSCKDTYSGSLDEVSACNVGCYAYVVKGDKPQIEVTSPNWFTSILSYFRSMVNKIRSQLMSPQDAASESQPISQPDDQSIVTRIRIFYLVRPDEDEASRHVPRSLENGRSSMVHLQSQHDVKSGVVADSRVQHKVVDHPRIISQDWRIACFLRKAFSDPIRLLFLVTVITLFVLLVAQFVLCIRRMKRSNRYSYVPLPTYAEAVEVKLPFEANNEAYESFTKEPKKSDA